MATKQMTARQFADDLFVFQEDSAPSHCAYAMLNVCARPHPEFFSPDLWPPNSPDLNPVAYKI